MEDRGYIWTKHALNRLKQRKVTKDEVSEVIANPSSTFDKEGVTHFIKKHDGYEIEAITKQADSGDLIVLSAWADPPRPGTKDFKHRQRYLALKHASAIRKLWYTFLTQMGL